MFLVPSEFVRDKLLPSGLPAAPIKVLAHFRALPSDEQLHTEKGYLLSVDRLSEERGAMICPERTRSRPACSVVGFDGPAIPPNRAPFA